MELFKAHNQWKSRPADERFKSVAEMHAACDGYRQQARSATVHWAGLRVEAQGEDIALVGRTGVPAKLTNWAAGQIASKVGAPISYLRELPPTLAAQNLNYGLKEIGNTTPTDTAQLLFHQNGSLMLRAATSESYTRIWNADITARLLRLQQDNPNWKNPLAYKISKPADGQGWPTLSGEMEPAGLYASDHDMFAFLVDESKIIEGSPQGLNRGFFVWNSEVGSSSFGVMTFLYDRVCGNNIVWGAKNVSEIRIRHVGSADTRAFSELSVELKKYADSSASEIEATIERAKNYRLGGTHEQALDALMSAIGKLRINDLSRKTCDEALAIGERNEARYGAPFTLWSAVSGLTEASQYQPYADARVKTDRAAGKLLSIAF